MLDLAPSTNMAGALTPPLRALLNLVPISRGETVPNEVLGSGDGTQPGQEFVLRKSPLTYLADPASASGNAYRSTLQVRVDGSQWQEVASFYGQPASAKVFTTREDAAGNTHVLFGDGTGGARLPSGRGNVVASYRVGSGAANPPDTALRVAVKPYPNLRGIRNPIRVWGGADPDPPDRIRGLAPRSVLAFGRAVSARDYEAIAAQTPGVARARAYWSWDADQARNTVKLYVGDDAAAVTAAAAALAGAGDSNRPLSLLPAKAITDPALTVFVTLEDGAQLDAVQAATSTALFDPDTGFFSARNMTIGRSIYRSQLVWVCTGIRGVAALHAIDFVSIQAVAVDHIRWDPGEGGFFRPSASNLHVERADK